ncbi:MAG: hypothetical protein GY832_05090 [Chloroflexi bacterium]|nr:hypothetical protein [Chloroflexota bacterium]
MTQNTDIPRRLSPWNPLDHLRLLWWVMVTPQQLVAYQEVFGKDDRRRVGKWLFNTLFWLPSLMLTLAMGLETLPYTDDAFSPATYLWMTVGLVVAWVLSGWLGEKKGYSVYANLFFGVCIVEMVVAVVVALGVEGTARDGRTYELILGMFFIILFILFTAMIAVLFDVELDRYCGLFGGDKLFIIGLVTLVVYAALASFLLSYLKDTFNRVKIAGRFASVFPYIVLSIVLKDLRESLKAGKPSRLVQSAFALLMLVYALLIWFGFFGGWKVLYAMMGKIIHY